MTREGWLEVVLGGKRLVARTTNSLLGGPTHVYLALARGNTAVKVIWHLLGSLILFVHYSIILQVVLDHNASSLLMLGQRWKSVPLSKVIKMRGARKVKMQSSLFWVRIIVESESLK